ncbi:MAG: hypothetical protein HY815_07605, partial [Candidatus Riflebacteria bacterium]|nr:hypothetical protein [Candidatus Riflebacteria bacterium]
MKAWVYSLSFLGIGLLTLALRLGTARSRALTRRDAVLASLSLGGLAGFWAIYLLFVAPGSPSWLDTRIHDLLGGHRETWSYVAARSLTALGDWRLHWILLLGPGLILCRRHDLRFLLVFALTFLATSLSVLELKAALSR